MPRARFHAVVRTEGILYNAPEVGPFGSRPDGLVMAGGATNEGKGIESMTLKSNLKISPVDLHAVWLLMIALQRKEGVSAGADLLGVLPSAELQDMKRLLKVAEALKLVTLHGKNVGITKVGARFARLPHWRHWRPTKESGIALGTLNALRTLLLDPTKLPKKRLVIDLFSGSGGLTYGFETAGYEVGVAVDNDPQSCEAHRRNFPKCHVVEGDINAIVHEPVEHLCRPFGLNKKDIAGVIGGPPCQGFSYIGERDVSDERNLLTSKFMDIVLALEPDFFVMENVAGLATSGSPPKLSDYFIQMAKPIGTPASAIVDALPAIPNGVAKRDRQFRKRTISEAILQFKSSFEASTVTSASPSEVVRLTASALRLLRDTLTRALTDSYPDEHVRKEAQSTILGDRDSLALIAAGSVVELLIKRKLLREEGLTALLASIKSKSGVSEAYQKTINTFEQLPKAARYKGVLVGPVLSHLIQRASKLYEVAPPTALNAAWYGTPQERTRLFLVGIHKRIGKAFHFPAPSYAIPKNGAKQELPLHSNAPTCGDAISDLPDVNGFAHLLDDDRLPRKELAPQPSVYASKMRLQVLDADDLSLSSPFWNPFIVDGCKRTTHEEKVIERLRKTPEGGMETTSHRRRLSSKGLSHTIRAGTREEKGSHTAVRPIHYKYPRVITVREAARIMGYPDWMTFHPTKWHGFRLVGNGVPAQLGRAVARAIRESLEQG